MRFGWRNFEVFRSTVIDRAKTRMVSEATEQGNFDPDSVAKLGRQAQGCNRGREVGALPETGITEDSVSLAHVIE